MDAIRNFIIRLLGACARINDVLEEEKTTEVNLNEMERVGKIEEIYTPDTTKRFKGLISKDELKQIFESRLKHASKNVSEH